MSEPISYRLKLMNVTCASCISTIEAALSKIPDIDVFQVNFAERAVVIKGHAKPQTVIAALNAVGYESQSVDEHNDDAINRAHSRKLITKTLLPAILGAFLMLLSITPWQPALITVAGQWFWLIIAAITAGVMWYAAGHIYNNALKALGHRHATMDTLIAVGTGVAWIYSVIISIAPQWVPSIARHVYFETALIVIALVNLGAVLESRARSKTSQSIQRLLGLQAKTASVVRDNGVEENVAIETLIVGDVIHVRPGEKIAVDGVLIEGHATIDESMFTGESMPVTKSMGDSLLGSTINRMGSFLFKATKVGKDTALAQIIQWVQRAQGSKPPIARLADQISAYFVPAVLIIAIMTALFWFNLGFPAGFIMVASMTVLVIACPCALGLATPIAVIVGMGKAAEYGILIRNAEALQRAGQLDVVMFDKTGTITKGQPAVVNIITQHNFDKNKLLQLAASLEQSSEHPFAQAIIEQAKAQNLALFKVENFEAIIGCGVQGMINNQTVLFGNDKLMHQHQLTVVELLALAEPLSLLGQTPLYLAVDQQVVGIIAVADPIKPEAEAVIQQLQHMGLNVVMITGDNQQTAAAVAKQVGISTVYAEVLPQDKALHVKQLQEQNKIVAMVGDGINDAPALTQADVGFAIGAGTDVAIESSDITMISNSLSSVRNAIIISKATMRNIKQNLWGAFIYNIVSIPVAAGLLYPMLGVLLNPMLAAAAMAASSLTVITNANRLRFLRIDE